jgi:hypothetical protein
MLIPFGTLAASGGVPGTYELIQTFTVSGTAVTDISFTSLGAYASTYKHLQLRIVGRSTRAAADDAMFIQLNGDTGANYAWHRLLGNGSTASSTGLTGIAVPHLGVIPANSATANLFGGVVADLIDPYSTTKNTTIRSLAGFAISWIALHSVLHLNTSAITSIRLFNLGGNMQVGSRFSLYGIRG